MKIEKKLNHKAGAKVNRLFSIRRVYIHAKGSGCILIPDITQIRGMLVEIHGSPDVGKTKDVVNYINQMQKKYDILTYYVDVANDLKAFKGNIDTNKVWIAFDINSDNEIATMCKAAKVADLIVIDDITFYHENVDWLLNKLNKLAYVYDTAIIVLNQMRFVLNHRTGEHEEKPYRYNRIQKYCSIAIDMDNQTFTKREEKTDLDDFADFLLKA